MKLGIDSNIEPVDTKFDKYNFTLNDVCHCECHNEELSVMHCVPCCDLCYAKYLTKDGKLQADKYIKFKEL